MSKKPNITQGSVFSGAKTMKDYGEPALGVIITARCDIAQSKKVYQYHYVPAVKFENWISTDFTPIFCNKKFDDSKSQVIELAKKYNIEKHISQILSTYDFSDIPQIINMLKLHEHSITGKEHKNKYATFMDNIKELYDVAKLKDESQHMEFLKKVHRTKEFKKLLDEIFNSNKGFYYIHKFKGIDTSYVILLREIYPVSEYFIKALGNNNEIDSSVLQIMEDFSYNNLHTVSEKNFIYELVGEIESPQIEHLMQKFAFIFSRIGLDEADYNFNFVTSCV